MSTRSVAERSIASASDQRPDSLASISDDPLVAACVLGNRFHGRDPLLRTGERDGHAAAVVSGRSSPSSSWMAISTGPARPGDTVMFAIAFGLQKCVKNGSSGSLAGRRRRCGPRNSTSVTGFGPDAPSPGRRTATATRPASSNASSTGNLLTFLKGRGEADEHQMAAAGDEYRRSCLAR